MSEKKNEVMGMMQSLHQAKQKTEQSNVETKENKTENSTQSTRGRKKKVNVERKIKGNKITYVKQESGPTKLTKTYYLKEDLVHEVEKLAEKVGLSSSDLVEDAIQLLLNNASLQGFDEEE